MNTLLIQTEINMKKRIGEKRNPPMMACGHAANSTCNGKPACAICTCTVIAKEAPSLKDRKAVCLYCNTKVPSSTNLPFFEYRPKLEYDGYYCGCRGWD